MDYITILEYIGVFAFAVSGAIVAIEEEFDVFGVYIIAIITAMGGGVLRDIVSDVGIPVFFTSYMTIPFIIAGTLLAIFLKGNLKYKNLRGKYLENIWQIINWAKVEELYNGKV